MGNSSLTRVRAALPGDAAVLARIAAVTFPLACPPTTTDEAKADFIARHLSQPRFAEYLADATRAVLLLEEDGRAVGYSMLVFEEPYDEDVRRVVTRRPTTELSKFYILPERHGSGLAAALMAASTRVAQQRGAQSVWLGVNQYNERANRFYARHGLERVGTKRFLVGDVWEHDFVRELILPGPAAQ